jgi:hypothetical protein
MKKNKKNGAGQCSKCLPAQCCTYFAFEIETPTTRQDYDSYLWKLAHDKISIYINRKRWHIMIDTRCRFLTPANTCGIYENRPYLCREYSAESCDYTSDNYGFTEHFRSYDDLLRYIKKKTKFRFRQNPAAAPRVGG